jgi:hypothetical protein
MIENVVAAASNRKKFLTKSGRRLCAWMKYRIDRSSTPWVQLKLDQFVQLTGISRRTCERQLEIIRKDPQFNVIIRCVHEDRRWKLLASTSDRLHKLQRSEPFTKHEDGKDRIVKIRKSGRRLNENQMMLGKDTSFWKAETDDLLTTDQEVEDTQDSKSSVCHPKQETLNLLGEQRTENPPLQTHFFGRVPAPTSNRHFFSRVRAQQVEQRSKHAKCGFEHRLLNLSFFMARNEIANLWWDNCKIAHSMPHAVAFCRDALRNGCKRRTIVKAYDIALHEMHAEAVDQGETEPGAWMPSSTISRARTILRENGCHHRFKPLVEEVSLEHWQK